MAIGIYSNLLVDSEGTLTVGLDSSFISVLFRERCLIAAALGGTGDGSKERAAVIDVFGMTGSSGFSLGPNEIYLLLAVVWALPPPPPSPSSPTVGVG